MKKITFLFSLLVAIGLQTHAQLVVNPTSATTTFVPAFGTLLSTLHDGTGLVSFPSLTSDHVPTAPNNSFVGNGTSGSITFNFSGTFLINGISFWNQNNGGPFTDVGADSVNFYASTNGTTYTLIPGAPTSYLEVFTDTSGPEINTFTGVLASSIRMDIIRNHGNTSLTGFGEIAFAASTVGINELAFGAVKVYPNPSKDFIALEGIGVNRDFIIYNMSGQIMQRGIISQGERINVQSLTKGLYFIRLEESNLWKFVKE